MQRDVFFSHRSPLLPLHPFSPCDLFGLLLVLGWVSVKTHIMLTSVHNHVRAKNLKPIGRLQFHASCFSDMTQTAALQNIASHTQAWVLVNVTRRKFLIRFFLRWNPLFSHISRFFDPKWVYPLSRTEHFHSAKSLPCSEPPQWLASSLPIQTTKCRLQTPMRTVPQQNVHLRNLSKSWPKDPVVSVSTFTFSLQHLLLRRVHSFAEPFVLSLSLHRLNVFLRALSDTMSVLSAVDALSL